MACFFHTEALESDSPCLSGAGNPPAFDLQIYQYISNKQHWTTLLPLEQQALQEGRESGVQIVALEGLSPDASQRCLEGEISSNLIPSYHRRRL